MPNYCKYRAQNQETDDFQACIPLVLAYLNKYAIVNISKIQIIIQKSKIIFTILYAEGLVNKIFFPQASSTFALGRKTDLLIHEL